MTGLYVKIGKLLQMERTRQDVKLDDLAAELKISLANLEAIENGDSTSLPSALYFKLFAKSYAEALGIDYEATVEAIEQDMTSSEQPAAANKDRDGLYRNLPPPGRTIQNLTPYLAKLPRNGPRVRLLTAHDGRSPDWSTCWVRWWFCS